MNNTISDKGGVINWFFGGSKNLNEKLATLVGILTSIIYVFGKFKIIAVLESTQYTLILDALNGGVLLLFLMLIKNKLIDEVEDERKFKSLEKVLTVSAKEIKWNVQRINHSTGQFVTSIRGFLFILFLFYVAQFFMDLEPYNDWQDSTQAVLKSKFYFMQLIGTGYEQDNIAARKLVVDFLNNALNLYSSAFILMAFQVLYGNTIRKDNTPSRRHYIVPLCLATTILFLNVIFVCHGVANTDLYNLKRLIGMLCGLYSAASMLLLFSRFISMEHFFDKADVWVKWFYQTGIIVSLPFYAVVQVLYGLFDDPTSTNPEIFRSIIFLVCLWGKLVFLLFVYTIIEYRWLHAYLLMVLCHQDTMNKVSKELPSVADFDKAIRPTTDSNILEPV